MTCATVSLSTSASAPIYVVETITVGGAISGYWAMGSEKAESSPNMVKSRAATIADNGCLIKNLVMNESPVSPYLSTPPNSARRIVFSSSRSVRCPQR